MLLASAALALPAVVGFQVVCATANLVMHKVHQ
jgi:hypothetical protein